MVKKYLYFFVTGTFALLFTLNFINGQVPAPDPAAVALPALDPAAVAPPVQDPNAAAVSAVPAADPNVSAAPVAAGAPAAPAAAPTSEAAPVPPPVWPDTVQIDTGGIVLNTTSGKIKKDLFVKAQKIIGQSADVLASLDKVSKHAFDDYLKGRKAVSDFRVQTETAIGKIKASSDK